ncbi:MAG: hypothetical protein Q8R95_10245 [Azonexus sp.]|nr:hypothetical protein [Azonexus sp.]
MIVFSLQNATLPRLYACVENACLNRGHAPDFGFMATAIKNKHGKSQIPEIAVKKGNSTSRLFY